MKAARYHGARQPLRIEDIPVPKPGYGEALVRVKGAGVCHTDLHFIDGVLDLGVRPITLGHEIVGVVEEIGPGVNNVNPGDRVIVYYYEGCGSCRFCLVGEENLCERVRAEYGFISDGGYAQFVKVRARNLVELPKNIDFYEAAPIGCSVTTAIRASRRAGVREGEAVVVYGVGGVGLALIQYNKLLGAEVIATGRNKAKLDRAKELGADHVINAGEEDPVKRVMEITGGRGANVVYELVGVRETMDNSLKMLSKRGRLIFIGYSWDRLVANPLELVVKEAVITASVGNTLLELVEAINLVARGKVKTIVSKVARLEEINNVLKDLREGKVVGRAVIDPWL